MIAYWLIGLIIAAAFLPMLIEGLRGEFDPFNIKNAFIGYYVLQLALSGLVPLSNEQASIFGPPPIGVSRYYYEAALNLSLWGMVCFQIGYYLSKSSLALPSSFRLRWCSGRVNLLMALSIVSGVGALVSLVGMPGVNSIVEFRNRWRAGELQGVGPITFLATTLPALALIVWVAHKGMRLRINLRVVVITALALGPAFVMGFRFLFMFPLLQLALIWHYNVRRLSTARMIALFTLCGLVFTAYGIWRTIPAEVEVDWEAAARLATEDPELVTTLLSRSKGTEVVASVVKKLDETGAFEYGYRSVLEAFTSLIPRGIWEDKPLSFGERFTTYFFGGDLAFDRNDYERSVWGGISPTVIGELYWHFWWPGVIFGLFFLGFIARFAYNTLRANRNNRSVLVFYAILFVHFLGLAEAPTTYLDSLAIQTVTLVLVLYSLSITLSPVSTRASVTPAPKESAPN